MFMSIFGRMGSHQSRDGILEVNFLTVFRVSVLECYHFQLRLKVYELALHKQEIFRVEDPEPPKDGQVMMLSDQSCKSTIPSHGEDYSCGLDASTAEN